MHCHLAWQVHRREVCGVAGASFPGMSRFGTRLSGQRPTAEQRAGLRRPLRITIFAGGDCDGDDVVVAFLPSLVAFVEATQLNLLPVKPEQKEATKSLTFKVKGWKEEKDQAVQYLEYALWVVGKNIASTDFMSEDHSAKVMGVLNRNVSKKYRGII